MEEEKGEERKVEFIFKMGEAKRRRL